ncbi:hypothetical protein EVAR_70426_1 [Eumeta japonica]|uniref:Uncharacterized protein n=1 Tax=Eumeta variegata TaxID=151549 RepID=A0A4C2A8T0_EUMVA|nr:hypothetical protein EVAR_70426_1 [Eumeta japonica]
MCIRDEFGSDVTHKDFEYVNCSHKGSQLPGRIEMKLKERTDKTHYKMYLSIDTALCEGSVCFTHSFVVRSMILVRDSVKPIESYKMTCKYMRGRSKVAAHSTGESSDSRRLWRPPVGDIGVKASKRSLLHERRLRLRTVENQTAQPYMKPWALSESVNLETRIQNVNDERSVFEREPAEALPRRRNRARARRADGAVNQSEHRGERERGITVAARCTLRGTTHTHTGAEPDTQERGSKAVAALDQM